MIPRLAYCHALNRNFPLFSRTCRISHTFYPAKSPVPSLRTPSPFASRTHVSGFHHSSRISDVSAKDLSAKGHHRPAHTAVGHDPAPRPVGIDVIPSDYASLDGVSPEESLKRPESCQSTGTLDTNSKCSTPAYSEVKYPHNRSLAPLTASL